MEKHAKDSVYGGSIIKQGEMDAIVTGTGMNSFFGRTAKLVSEATTKSHLQKAVIKETVQFMSFYALKFSILYSVKKPFRRLSIFHLHI